MSINRVCISGGLTRDPELRATQGGGQILTFGVAVTDRRKDSQTGEWKDYPNYVDCVVFGKRAESLSRFLSKGVRVIVDGKLRWSQWEKDGYKRSKIEVIVDDLEFNSRQRDSQGDSGASNADNGSGGHYGTREVQNGSTGLYDEEIPF